VGLENNHQTENINISMISPNPVKKCTDQEHSSVFCFFNFVRYNLNFLYLVGRFKLFHFFEISATMAASKTQNLKKGNIQVASPEYTVTYTFVVPNALWH